MAIPSFPLTLDRTPANSNSISPDVVGLTAREALELRDRVFQIANYLEALNAQLYMATHRRPPIAAVIGES